MTDRVPDFAAIGERARAAASPDAIVAMFDHPAVPALAAALAAGGGVVFPHASFATCGHQIAATVRAAFDAARERGADRVVALGVMHALTPELRAAREAFRADGSAHPLRGVHEPDGSGHATTKATAPAVSPGEFSLDHLRFLWDAYARRHAGPAPALLPRFPFLTGARPSTLPGWASLRDEARDAVVVATADLVHHGCGYGDPAETARPMGPDGERVARTSIAGALDRLVGGDHAAFIEHAERVRSDGRDTLPVAAELIGIRRAELVDLVLDDMTGPYDAPDPTWVACALVTLHRA